jgi:hypothetical protein
MKEPTQRERKREPHGGAVASTTEEERKGKGGKKKIKIRKGGRKWIKQKHTHTTNVHILPTSNPIQAADCLPPYSCSNSSRNCMAANAAAIFVDECGR